MATRYLFDNWTRSVIRIHEDDMPEQTYTLEFSGRAGDDNDVKVQRAIRAAGGEVVGAGTFLAAIPTQRDIEFVVPAEQAKALVASLRLMGFDPKAKVR
jgi:hypothetical protein